MSVERKKEHLRVHLNFSMKNEERRVATLWWKLFWAPFCRKGAQPAVCRSSLGSHLCAVGLWPCRFPARPLLSPCEGRSAQPLCRASGAIQAGGRLLDAAPVPPYRNNSRVSCCPLLSCCSSARSPSTAVAASLCRGPVQQGNEQSGKKPHSSCVTDEGRMCFVQGLIWEALRRVMVMNVIRLKYPRQRLQFAKYFSWASGSPSGKLFGFKPKHLSYVHVCIYIYI